MNPALVRRHEHPLVGEQRAAQTSPETHARDPAAYLSQPEAVASLTKQAVG